MEGIPKMMFTTGIHEIYYVCGDFDVNYHSHINSGYLSFIRHNKKLYRGKRTLLENEYRFYIRFTPKLL